ncbi:MAG TPA: hypothetical protein VFW48_03860, partial [Solirubrobacterales bacterium]|nr:hypothetical protein [Solirubrobacterales bacterium]
NVPKYMQELVGDLVEGEVEVQAPLLSKEVVFEVQGDQGQCSTSVELRPAEPLEGWDKSFSGGGDGMTVTLSFRMREGKGEVNVTWHWQLDTSLDPRSQVEALRMMEALAGEGEVRLLDPASGNEITKGPTPTGLFGQELASLKQVLEDVISLQDWLGEEIEVPEEIKGAEAVALRRVALLLEGRRSSWQSASIGMASDTDREQLEEGGVLQVRQELEIELFGKRYPLGEEVTYVDRYRLARTEPGMGGGIVFILEPEEGSEMMKRLERKRS